MSNYSTSVSCKKCGKTAILKVTGVQPNSTGGATAFCNTCYSNSGYTFTLTEGAFSYLR